MNYLKKIKKEDLGLIYQQIWRSVFVINMAFNNNVKDTYTVILNDSQFINRFYWKPLITRAIISEETFYSVKMRKNY